MSGGHFEYSQTYIQEIISKLEHDMRAGPYEGWKHSEETKRYLRLLVSDLQLVYRLVQEYDLAVCADTSIEKFNKVALATYGNDQRGDMLDEIDAIISRLNGLSHRLFQMPKV